MQEQLNAELEAKLNWFEEQLSLSRARQFTSSSKHTDKQLQLFNENETKAQLAFSESAMEEVAYRRKKRGHRTAQLKDLPVEIIEYRLSPVEQVCS